VVSVRLELTHRHLGRGCGTTSAPEYANTKEEAEVIPSSAVGECINPNAVVEQVANEGEKDRESVPDAHEESGRVVRFGNWLVCTRRQPKNGCDQSSDVQTV